MTDTQDKGLEAVAKKEYGFLDYDGPGDKPAWVPGGNSDKQIWCRDKARALIDVWEAEQWRPIAEAPGGRKEYLACSPGDKEPHMAHRNIDGPYKGFFRTVSGVSPASTATLFRALTPPDKETGT